ncbi:MAG: hypothetical protein EHM35_03885 [Planctomycetaceae bacterium]|nr:MAG: hypothetical protein EHM35_03885 [Planctomycetaceae bacterium]
MAEESSEYKMQRPTHKPVSANAEGRVAKTPGVDYRQDELSQTKEPIRPATWKPKQTFVGNLTLRVKQPEGLRAQNPVRVTLIRAHRPRKAEQVHVQRTEMAESPEKGVVFEELPAGDYLIICQLRRYRPFVSFVRFTRQTPEFEIGSPLHPARSLDEEKVLLREGERHPFVEDTRRFLARFGYLRPARDSQKDTLSEQVSMALRRFQKTYDLDATGTLTVETLALMLQPRCAVPDIMHDEPLESSAGPVGAAGDPIVFMGNRWDNMSLRYRLFDGTSDISNEWSLIRAAMDRWAQVSPLAFSEVSSDSDLEFDFRRPGEAGYPFDEGGNKDGNVLAHAWGPSNGTVEFDDHEDWGSTSLPAVSTHEIGHALGLAHSGVEDATMYPWYDGGQATLHEVDVRGIKSLYTPVYRHNGPFVAYPLFAFNSEMGTDSVTIDLGAVRHFLAWGTITMIDSLIDLDRDNMCFIDVYEVDGNRTNWRVSGGDHLGSANSPGNAYEGTYVGYGRRITFRITAGHVSDLEASGHAMVLVLS